MSSRPTIQMVAEEAAVSRGTVDRVLNNRSYVSAEVRTRVLEAIRKVGYIAPRQAHKLNLEGGFQPITLGILMPNFAGHFQTETERGIARACAELMDFQVRILVRWCKTDIPGEAIELIDDLVANGIQGLALCALDDVSIEARVAMLADDGIPCITFNSDLPNSKRLCFVGQDIRKAGRVAAELMSKCIPSNGQLLATVGNLEFNGHRRRLNGFCERLQELGFRNDQITIKETYNDYATTMRVVTETLQKIPDLCGIYMANLSVAGCAEAVRAAGKKGQIRVICHDVNEGIQRLLLEGSIDLTIPQDIMQQSYASLLFLRELLQKQKEPDPEQLNTKISILCSQNL